MPISGYLICIAIPLSARKVPAIRAIGTIKWCTMRDLFRNHVVTGVPWWNLICHPAAVLHQIELRLATSTCSCVTLLV
jgi:hypothetical protein